MYSSYNARPKIPCDAYSPGEKEKSSTNVLIYLGFLSTIGAILIFVGEALPLWRTTPEISYHFMRDSKPSIHTVVSSSYGLYLLHFNKQAPGGSNGYNSVSRTWYLHQSAACIGKSLGFDITGHCNGTCQRHMATRCNVYQRICHWGYITFGVLTTCACLALLASLWVFMLRPEYTLLVILWLGSGLVGAAITATWIFITDSGFLSLQVDSQYPYPSLAVAAFLTLGGVGILIFCGIVTLIIAYGTDRNYWEERQSKINTRVLQDFPASKQPVFNNNGLMSAMPPSAPGYNQQQNPPFPINMPPQLPNRHPPTMNGFPSMFPHGNFQSPGNMYRPPDAMGYRLQCPVKRFDPYMHKASMM